MSSATHDIGIQSVHDQVVNLVAERWATTMQCTVTVNTPAREHGWSTAERKYPDLIGLKTGPKGNLVEWIAEVETEESFSELDAHGRWQDYTALGLRFYLFVPKGRGATAEFFASRAGARINRIFEYSFVEEQFQLA